MSYAQTSPHCGAPRDLLQVCQSRVSLTRREETRKQNLILMMLNMLKHLKKLQIVYKTRGIHIKFTVIK